MKIGQKPRGKGVMQAVGSPFIIAYPQALHPSEFYIVEIWTEFSRNY